MSCNGIEPLLGTPVPAQIPWPGEIPGTAAPSCGAPALFMDGALRKENAGFLPVEWILEGILLQLLKVCLFSKGMGANISQPAACVVGRAGGFASKGCVHG